jgi:hypothetical protein
MTSIGTRFGDLSDLPEDLRKQLKLKRKDDQEFLIEILAGLDGAATVNEILIAAWRENGTVLKRQSVAAKLSAMRCQGLLAPRNVSDPVTTFRLPTGGQHDRR